jgi:hypothetical protein
MRTNSPGIEAALPGDGKTEVRMPGQRSISRIVTPGPAVAGCRKVGHSFIEVIQADDFINTDPFIRLTDDRMELRNKEIGAPHPHAGFEALELLLEGAIRNRKNGAVLNAGDLVWLTAGSGIIVPGARVVKAFNHLAANVLPAPEVSGGRRVLFYSGDDADATAEVRKIIEQTGYFAVDLGVLDVGGPLTSPPFGSLASVNFIEI